MVSLIRRRLLAAAAALPVVPAFAQTRPLTCGELTAQQTEGPFFKTNTPRRISLVELRSKAPRLVVTGQVLSAQCRPVANALLDFWHADEDGRALSPANHRSGGIPRAHAAYPRQGAGARKAHSHHAALLPGRARQPPRRPLPSRPRDAHGRQRRRRGKIRLRRRGLKRGRRDHFLETSGQLPSFRGRNASSAGMLATTLK